MPQIEHIVVLMMENHSFDNVLGMLPHGVRRGAGWTACRSTPRRRPTRSTAAPSGPVRSSLAPRRARRWASRARTGTPATCPSPAGATAASCGPAGRSPCGTGTSDDLPFTYSLASTFPVGERYFCSVLAQTYPNRRFLFTGTASGTIATERGDVLAPRRRTARSSTASTATGSVEGLLRRPRRAADRPGRRRHARPPARFVVDDRVPLRREGGHAARRSRSSSRSTTYESQEDPQDIQVGERFVARIARAVMESPNWERTRAVHHLRRARRLLRPRAAARRRPARRHAADARARTTSRAPTTATASACRCS